MKSGSLDYNSASEMSSHHGCGSKILLSDDSNIYLQCINGSTTTIVTHPKKKNLVLRSDQDLTLIHVYLLEQTLKCGQHPCVNNVLDKSPCINMGIPITIIYQAYAICFTQNNSLFTR